MIQMQDLHRELKFRMSRSSGSGGQHVNKVSTRVELLFDMRNSQALPAEEKAILLERLANRITQDGILQLSADGSRSQLLNKNAVIRKFDQLVKKALKPVKIRPEAGAFTADKRKRLQAKQATALRKAARRRVAFRPEDDL